MIIIWTAKVQRQQMTSCEKTSQQNISTALVDKCDKVTEENAGCKRTKPVPALALPFVAPVQYRPPQIKRMTHTSVWHVLMMARRPNVSVVQDQTNTAKRLTQLNQTDQSCSSIAKRRLLAHERITVPRKGSVKPAREKKSGTISCMLSEAEDGTWQLTG